MYLIKVGDRYMNINMLKWITLKDNVATFTFVDISYPIKFKSKEEAQKYIQDLPHTQIIDFEH